MRGAFSVSCRGRVGRCWLGWLFLAVAALCSERRWSRFFFGYCPKRSFSDGGGDDGGKAKRPKGEPKRHRQRRRRRRKAKRRQSRKKARHRSESQGSGARRSQPSQHRPTRPRQLTENAPRIFLAPSSLLRRSLLAARAPREPTTLPLETTQPREQTNC